MIKNDLTSSHKRVEGTNVYLIVPGNFLWIARSRELVDSKIGASIIVNAIEIPIDQLHQEMSKDVLLSQGSILISDKPISVNNYSGYWIETSRQTFREKQLSHVLIFGVDKFSYVVQTIFPEPDKQFEKQSRQILNSVVYKKVFEDSSKPYDMDFKRYSFGFVESKNNIDYYQSLDKDLKLTVEVEYFFTDSNTDPGIIFYTRMQRLPYVSTEFDEKGIQDITINAMQGLHALITATTEKGESVYVYQLLLSERNKHFLVIGKSHVQSTLLIVSDLAKTFRKIN